MSEFNLSEKMRVKPKGIKYEAERIEMFLPEDVKEFIKRRINDLHDINNGSINCAKALAKLRIDAGDKLI